VCEWHQPDNQAFKCNADVDGVSGAYIEVEFQGTGELRIVRNCKEWGMKYCLSFKSARKAMPPIMPTLAP